MILGIPYIYIPFIAFSIYLVAFIILMKMMGGVFIDPIITRLNELPEGIKEEVLSKKYNYENFLEANGFILDSLYNIKLNNNSLQQNIINYLSYDKTILASIVTNNTIIYILFESIFENDLVLSVSDFKEKSNQDNVIFLYKKLSPEDLLKEHLKNIALIGFEKVKYNDIDKYIRENFKKEIDSLIKKKMYKKSNEYIYMNLSHILKLFFIVNGFINANKLELLKPYYKNKESIPHENELLKQFKEENNIIKNSLKNNEIKILEPNDYNIISDTKKENILDTRNQNLVSEFSNNDNYVKWDIKKDELFSNQNTSRNQMLFISPNEINFMGFMKKNGKFLLASPILLFFIYTFDIISKNSVVESRISIVTFVYPLILSSLLFSFFKFFVKKDVSIKGDTITWNYSFFILKLKKILNFSDYSDFKLTAYYEEYQIAKWKSTSYFNDDITISLTRSLKDVENDLSLFKTKVLKPSKINPTNQNNTKQNLKLDSYDNSGSLVIDNKLELKDLLTALVSSVIFGAILYHVFSFFPTFNISFNKNIGIKYLFLLIPLIVFLTFFRALLLMIWEIIRIDKITISKDILLERKLFFFRKRKEFKLNDFVLYEIKKQKQNKISYTIELLKNTEKWYKSCSLPLLVTDNANENTRYLKNLEKKYPHIYDRLLVTKIKDKTKIKSIFITTVISIIAILIVSFFNFIRINGTLYYHGEAYYGKRITYYNDGKTKDTEGFYINGKLEGKFSSWYYKGQKESELFFENNKPEGKFIFWYKNGKPKQELIYENGKLIKTTEWSEEGKVLKMK